MAYHTLVTKVEAFGREFVTLVTVKQSPDGSRFYNSVAMQAANEKAPAAYPGDRASKDVGSATAFTGAAGSVLPAMRRVNPDTVSKVVDPNTGEPLVVYLGTDAVFHEFDPDKSGSAASPAINRSRLGAGTFGEAAKTLYRTRACSPSRALRRGRFAHR